MERNLQCFQLQIAHSFLSVTSVLSALIRLNLGLCVTLQTTNYYLVFRHLLDDLKNLTPPPLYLEPTFCRKHITV